MGAGFPLSGQEEAEECPRADGDSRKGTAKDVEPIPAQQHQQGAAATAGAWEAPAGHESSWPLGASWPWTRCCGAGGSALGGLQYSAAPRPVPCSAVGALGAAGFLHSQPCGSDTTSLTGVPTSA